MAITVSTRPSEYSNSSIFITSTDVAEDSTHVNTRIEATLYVNGVAIAKKVKPKGIATFDFTDILESKCLFTNPAIDDSSGTTIIDAGKTGSNLITGWTQDGSYTFVTFTTSGANWTSVSINETEGRAYTNSISVTLGKVYVILAKKGVAHAQGLTIRTKTTTSNGNITSFTSTGQRVYYQPRVTGSVQIEVVANSGTSIYDSTNWEMYEMNLTDWYCPYYISFTEKYEDASGATQTGSTTTETSLNNFFKSNATTFTDYVIATNQKFLKPDGYNLSSSARSFSVIKTLPSGYRTSALNLGVISPINYQIKTRVTPYNSSDVAQTDVDSSLQDIYCPIIGVHTNQSLVATYPRADLKLMSASSTVASETLRYDQIITCFPDILHLVWKNKTGGFSEYTFPYSIGKSTQYEKDYYKDVNKKDKIIPTSIVANSTITAYTPLSVTEKQLEYIQDLLESTQVYWQRAADDLVSVTVKSESITTKMDNEFTPFQIEISW